MRSIPATLQVPGQILEPYMRKTGSSSRTIATASHRQRETNLSIQHNLSPRIASIPRPRVTAEGANQGRGETPEGDIRFRIANDAPLSLSYAGDMEGRAVRLEPDGDGYSAVIIGRKAASDSHTNKTNRMSRGAKNATRAPMPSMDRSLPHNRSHPTLQASAPDATPPSYM